VLAPDRRVEEYISKLLDMVDQEAPQGYETGTYWIAKEFVCGGDQGIRKRDRRRTARSENETCQETEYISRLIDTDLVIPVIDELRRVSLNVFH